MIAISGNTYPVKDQLRSLGGKWDANQKAWLVPDEKAEEAKKLVTGAVAATNQALTAPTTPFEARSVSSNGLDERAMLVYLSIGFWEGRKKDKEKSKEVMKDEHAHQDSGTWWTRIVPPSATKPVVNAR